MEQGQAVAAGIRMAGLTGARKWARLLLMGLCCLFFAVRPSLAQGNCPENWPPPGLPAGLPCPEAHSATVELEHEDRIARLKRLAGSDVQPTFSTDYLSPSEHKISGYPVNIPVLRVVFDTDVFFDTNSSEIRPEAFPVLRIISDDLAKEPRDVAMYVVGHTDSQGNEDYNYNLGLSRANAVAEALARRGIYQAAIYRLSFGEGYPVASNETEAGRARNRRVEFLFAATPKAGELYVRKMAVSPCIARDENGVETCKRPVEIEVKKVEVSMEDAKQVAELNREETALENTEGLGAEELNRRRQEIEVKRQKIAIVPQRERIAINPRRALPTETGATP